MQFINDSIITATSMGATITGEAVNVNQIICCTIHAVWTGTPTGSIKLQASCDKAIDPIGTGVTNWEDIADTSTAISGAAGSQMWNFESGIGFNWIRCVYTRTSGTGTLDVRYNGKG